MTLNAELAMSIEHKVHRVHYQSHHHHHHYHVHHLLPHHKLLDHNHHHYQHHQQPRKALALNQPKESQHQKAIVDHSDQHHRQHDQDHDHHQKEQHLHHDQDKQLVLKQQQHLVHVNSADNQKTVANQQAPQQKPTLRSRHLTLRNQRLEAARLKQKSQIQFFIFLAFAYILSPIDLIPELIFGVFGILDDILFLLLCLCCIAIILLYPIFREVRRAIFDRLGLKPRQPGLFVANKSF